LLEADRTALALRTARDRLSLPLARAARAFVAASSWTPFGYARLGDFARERLRRSGRWLRDLGALDDAMRSLPPLADALTGDDGGRPLGRVAALMIGRTASPESVDTWIALARCLTVRDLKEAIRRARAARSVAPVPGERVDDRSVDETPGIEDDDLVERSLVRILVPSSVRIAFDEVLDLHRAVTGGEASVESFVEALVAESLASGRPPDADLVPLNPCHDPAIAERALARSTSRWRHLSTAAGSDALAEAGIVLARLEVLSRTAGRGGPADLLEQLLELIGLEDEIERKLGRLLAEMGERGAWIRLRFAGMGHYAEERLGVCRTSAENRAWLARGLARFPILRGAYESGRIGFEAALLLRRILGVGPIDRRIEEAWVARAEEATLKRLKDEARAIDRDTAAGEERRPLDDATWSDSIRRAPGRTVERVRSLGAHAESVGFPDVFLRLRLPNDLASRFLGAIETARNALTVLVDEVPWHEPWPEPDAPSSVLLARTFSTRCRRVPAWVGLFSLLEEYTATWDDPAQSPRRAGDAVYTRAGWRCTAPGCTSRRNLEDHHVIYRSRGGDSALDNRICLCRFHHKLGEHGALASCTGKAPLGILWRLGKEEIGRWYRNERAVSA
jgi:hypothetical protein